MLDAKQVKVLKVRYYAKSKGERKPHLKFAKFLLDSEAENLTGDIMDSYVRGLISQYKPNHREIELPHGLWSTEILDAVLFNGEVLIKGCVENLES